jgi:hypothetical protein
MLGVQDNTTYMGRAASAGVHDYLLEGSTGRQILDTIRDATSGKPPSPSTSYGKVLAAMRDRSSNPAVDLTPRDMQVLRHVGYGVSDDEIPRSPEISVETIKEHVKKPSKDGCSGSDAGSGVGGEAGVGLGLLLQHLQQLLVDGVEPCFDLLVLSVVTGSGKTFCQVLKVFVP